MRMRIVAQGSTKRDRERREWGLSILIDDDVLFDTYTNPEALERYFRLRRIDDADIKHIVISHDHWDHTGGLWRLLELERDRTVYVCRKTRAELKERIRSCGARLVEVGGPVAIKDDVVSTGEIDGTYGDAPIVEQSLLLRNGGTLAVVTGWSHPGILAILSRAGRLCQEKIDLVMGGFHLADAGAAELEKIAVMLKKMSFTRFLILAIVAAAIILLVFGVIGPNGWDWKLITFLTLMTFALFIILSVPDHYLHEHIWEHIFKKHLWKIFLWSFGVILVIDIGLHYFDVEAFITANLVWVVLIAGLIGLIPESGPHLIFVMLFSRGLIPFSVLLTSSIVQDGHGMLPMLSYSVRDSVKVKLFNLAIGLALGFGLFFLGV